RVGHGSEQCRAPAPLAREARGLGEGQSRGGRACAPRRGGTVCAAVRRGADRARRQARRPSDGPSAPVAGAGAGGDENAPSLNVGTLSQLRQTPQVGRAGSCPSWGQTERRSV